MRHDIWRGIVGGLGIAGVVMATGMSADGEQLAATGLSKWLAASGITGLAAGLLLVILAPLGHRVDRTAPRNRWLIAATVIFFVGWLVLRGLFRNWAQTSGLGSPWVLGVAPSLLAGLTVALGSAVAYGFQPSIAVAFGAGFIILTELIQPWLPSYTLDYWDVVAGLVGACLAVPLLMRWPVAFHSEES